MKKLLAVIGVDISEATLALANPSVIASPGGAKQSLCFGMMEIASPSLCSGLRLICSP
jgi:hypothetical protein